MNLWKRWNQKHQNKKILARSLLVTSLLSASFGIALRFPSRADTITAAAGSIAVWDTYLNCNMSNYSSSAAGFGIAVASPEKIKKVKDAGSIFYNDLDELGISNSEKNKFSNSIDKKKGKVNWGDGDIEHYVTIYGAKVYENPVCYANAGICSNATIYTAIAEYESDEDSAGVANDQLTSADTDIAVRMDSINKNANNYEMVAVRTFDQPGARADESYADFNIVDAGDVFPESYDDVVYATEEDIAMLLPWYQEYIKYDSKGNVSLQWMTKTRAKEIYAQYKDTKYVNKDAVNAIWVQLSGIDPNDPNAFKFMERNITSYSSLRSTNSYNLTVRATLEDNFETTIPVDAKVVTYKNEDPSYTEKYGEIEYENRLSSTWEVSDDEQTWYTLCTNSDQISFKFQMITKKISIGSKSYSMPNEIKNSDIFYVRRISTASGIYNTAISPSVKIRPFTSFDGLDIYSKVDVVEGTYLDPSDIEIVAHYSGGDRVMSGKGNYITYPGETNLLITIVGDNWVYYEYTDPVTKNTIKDYFKVKGIQKSPVSMTAEYVGGSVVEMTNYNPQYLHINVTFNNGTIDTFTAESSNVGTYKIKHFGSGDLDANGVLNSTDVGILQNILNGQTASGIQKTQADVNQDGTINTADLEKLKGYTSKLVSELGINTFYAALAGLKLSDGSPQYARFTINGVKRTPHSITVVTEPLKTRYIEGDDFDPEGMVLKVLYDNGESQYITYGPDEWDKNGVTLGDTENPATNMKAEMSHLPIYYTENGVTVSTDLKLEVRLTKLTSIRVTRAPNTTVYYAGETFKNTGMEVTAYFDEGIEDHAPTEVLLNASEYVMTNYKALKNSTDYVVIRLDDPTSVPNASGDYLRVSKLALNDGQNFTDGANTTLEYKDGTTVRGTVCGNYLIHITYTNRGTTKETYLPIYVLDKKPTALTIVNMPYKTDYTAGEAFLADGLILRAAYSDGSSAYIYEKIQDRNGYVILQGDSLQAGQNYVVASYTENGVTLQTEIPITVLDPSIDGITASYLGPSVYKGQEFDPKDVQIVVSYSNGTVRSFRANEELSGGGRATKFVIPLEDGTVNPDATESMVVSKDGDNEFAACYAGHYDIFTVPGIAKPDQLDFSGSIAKTKRMYDTWSENFTAIKIRSVADYINGRVDNETVANAKVNPQTTTDTRQNLTSDEGTDQGMVPGTGVSPLLSFLREGSWRQPETVVTVNYKGRTDGFLYPETTNPKFTQKEEDSLEYIGAHQQFYDTPREELQSYMEEGWSDWVTNGDSVGTSKADREAYYYTQTGGDTSAETMTLGQVKIKLGDIPAGSNPQLNVTVKDVNGAVQTYENITENDTITNPAQIKMELDGMIEVVDNYGNKVLKNFGDVYKIYYRATVDDFIPWSKGGNETTEGEWAGFEGVPMQCLEIRLMLQESDFNVGTKTEAPVITGHPKDVTILVGGNATFSVTAIGNDLYYQWYCNGQEIPGANSPVYATPEQELSNSGDVYYCMVIANNGTGMSSKSDSATLTVKDQAPILIKDLEESVVCGVGDTITLSVLATCLNPSDLVYEWQISDGDSYVPLAGRVGPDLTAVVTPDMHGKYIRCHVSNSAGSVNSNPCQVICIEAPVVTIKSSEPSNYVALSKTEAITLTADVVSRAPGKKTYEWMIDGEAVNKDSDSIEWIPSTVGTHQVSCKVTDSIGKNGTGTYTIYVGQAPQVTLSATKARGQDKTWTVTVNATVTSYDSAHAKYVWNINGTTVTNATANATVSSDGRKLTITKAAGGSQLSVGLTVTDGFGKGSALMGIVTDVTPTARLDKITVRYTGPNPVTEKSPGYNAGTETYTVPKSDLVVTAFYDDGSNVVLEEADFIISPEHVDGTMTKYSGTVTCTENGVTKTGSFGFDVNLPEPIPEHTVTFDLDGGTIVPDGGTSAQTSLVMKVKEGSPITKPKNDPEKDGYIFKGWFSDAACTTEVNFPVTMGKADMNVYAKWEQKPDVKYAVSLYGIKHDTYKEENDNTGTAGLTFGPATGKNYVNTFKAHTPTGNTASGNAHRCIHNDDWSTIASWSQKDPYVYEQCIDGGGSGESCTKSVPIILSEKLKGTSYPNMSGDGAGILRNSIVLAYRKWNWENSAYFDASSDEYKFGTNKGGWPDSAVRNTLNGTVTDNMLNITNKDNGFAEAKLDENTALISCFPAILKDAIVPKAVKSDTVYNDVTGNNVTTYDKLWLLSGAETYVDSGLYDRDIRKNEGTSYERIIALDITTSNYSKNEGYDEDLYSAPARWLRSAERRYPYYVYEISSSGKLHYINVYSTRYGLAPGFCLR